jgi:hypothetical protein
MFIVQVMYAEGLVKILNWILVVIKYERQGQEEKRSQLQREIEILEMTEACLKALPRTASLDLAEKQLARQRTIQRDEHERYVSALGELRRRGIAREELEEKFKLISSDCTRISHGSVKPPEWATA